MIAPPQRSRFAAVIVAAGKGLRAGHDMPKQFAIWRGKPVLHCAAEALIGAGEPGTCPTCHDFLRRDRW